jgi:hypothetical protein
MSTLGEEEKKVSLLLGAGAAAMLFSGLQLMGAE